MKEVAPSPQIFAVAEAAGLRALLECVEGGVSIYEMPPTATAPLRDHGTYSADFVRDPGSFRDFRGWQARMEALRKLSAEADRRLRSCDSYDPREGTPAEWFSKLTYKVTAIEAHDVHDTTNRTKHMRSTHHKDGLVAPVVNLYVPDNDTAVMLAQAFNALLHTAAPRGCSATARYLRRQDGSVSDLVTITNMNEYDPRELRRVLSFLLRAASPDMAALEVTAGSKSLQELEERGLTFAPSVYEKLAPSIAAFKGLQISADYWIPGIAAAKRAQLPASDNPVLVTLDDIFDALDNFHGGRPLKLRRHPDKHRRLLLPNVELTRDLPKLNPDGTPSMQPRARTLNSKEKILLRANERQQSIRRKGLGALPEIAQLFSGGVRDIAFYAIAQTPTAYNNARHFARNVHHYNEQKRAAADGRAAVKQILEEMLRQAQQPEATS